MVTDYLSSYFVFFSNYITYTRDFDCSLTIREPHTSYCKRCLYYSFRGAKSKEWGFWRFARAKNGARAKIRRKEWGRGGKEGNACRQTPWFWKLPFGNERGSWLAGLVKHYWHVPIKGLEVPSAGKNVRSLFTKSLTFLTERVFSRELRTVR